MSAAAAYFLRPDPSQRRDLAFASLLLVGLFSWAAASCAQGNSPEPFVLTQVPRQAKRPPAARDSSGQFRADWFEGARVVLVSSGQTRVLSEGFRSACDPNVSFDAKHILFSGRKDHNAPWRVWEIGVDGQGLRPITPEDMDARSPIYATTLFTLESPEPWFTTLFVGQEATINEAGRVGSSSLYNIKLDGSEPRRLTFNPNHNLDPFQGWDGRVLYAAERYPNQPGAFGGQVRLHSIHVEGADMELYGGELGKKVQRMPCLTAGGLVVFVESNEGAWDGAGQLACLEERRPHVTYRQVTQSPSELYLYPSPLRDNVILVSKRPAKGNGTCGVFRFDIDRGSCAPVFDSPDYDEVQAVAVKPRKTPDGHSTVVDMKSDTGTFYGLNAYDADPRMASHLPKGTIKRVRFLEGVPQPVATPVPGGADSERAVSPVSSRPGSPSHPNASSQSGAPPPGGFVPRRLVGEAPVEEDGSFNVIVPADTPLLLQTLDAQGMALATCGWIWVKPKETRGCIGCHEDPERIPENEYVLALRRPSNRLALPPDQRRSISFVEDVAPILRKHCANAECHGGSKTPLALRFLNDKPSPGGLEMAYSALMRPLPAKRKGDEPLPKPGRYVDPGRSRTSWLVWQLVGTNTSRAWDDVAKQPGRNIKLMPPREKAAPLAEEEIRTILQWIDLGAPFAPSESFMPTSQTLTQP